MERKASANAAIVMLRQEYETMAPGPDATGVARLQPDSSDPTGSFNSGLFPAVSAYAGSGALPLWTASLKRFASSVCNMSFMFCSDVGDGALAITSKRLKSSALGPPTT